MAAIDKMHVSDYSDKEELVIWCIIHNPFLLNNIYEPFEGYDAWELKKRKAYEKMGVKDENMTDLLTIPITNFRFKQDKYLYWHCPLDFVREYLETQCGYKKANWFVKLFWRY